MPSTQPFVSLEMFVSTRAAGDKLISCCYCGGFAGSGWINLEHLGENQGSRIIFARALIDETSASRKTI